ncbi:uncharacterized protein LOC129913690 [Episyrphus balteatus]|uniref:uncharacterized protein LOC129913690 n=1 Tax=Episyrphus balteatus TaxID=286459 RepID=UPI0024859B15|nr:uncharacterized protein LOC129913690 [Episyrphus balteatus]
MFTLFLSILFTTCILAAPTPPEASSWSKLKEDKTLERFQSTLLNETFLPFLNECYTIQVGQSKRESKTQESICSRYFDAILQLNKSDFVVNLPNVIAIRDQVNASGAFCEQKYIFPSIKYYPKAPPRDFNNPAVCGVSCLEDDAVTPKAICKFLAWMGEEIIKHSSVGNGGKPVGVPLVPVVGAALAPAAAPTKVSQIQVVEVQSTPTVVLANENGKTPEDVKPDATTAAKPTLNSSNTHSLPAAQSIAQAETPIKIDNKDKNSPIDIPEPTQSAVVAPVVPVIPKEEKNKETQQQQQPLEEGKEEIAPAPLNSSAQDAIQQIQPAKTKQDSMENQDSDEELNSIGDDTGVEPDDYKDSLTNVGKSNVGIANPDDNEHNQSSSPEIIVGNDIVNNKPMVDPFLEESGSNFFTYFLVGMFLCIAMYVLYHNKSKVLALLLEGRRGDKGRSGRRKHTAAYRKLDSNLEEAITSSASGRTTQIIY